jgi:hypothetical protein
MSERDRKGAASDAVAATAAVMSERDRKGRGG